MRILIIIIFLSFISCQQDQSSLDLKTARTISMIKPASTIKPASHEIQETQVVIPKLWHRFDGEYQGFHALPEQQAPQIAPSENEDLGSVSLAPTPWDSNAFVRNRKRMDIDQLSMAFKQFDGIGWREGTREKWASYWATLGGPNFITRVTEDLRPSVLFTKIIRDAAIEVCLPLVAQELHQNIPLNQRKLIFMEDPSQLQNNDLILRSAISRLISRAHGIVLDDQDVEIDRWLSLLTQVYQENQSIEEAWQAICIATIIHPRFWSY